eukprot:jgi/Mesvir1/29605/Mv21460-RA.2
MLDRDLEDAEDQFQMALRSHLHVVDALIDLQYTRVKLLGEEFAANLAALEEEFDTERTEIINAHARQKKDIADMMAAMESEFEEAEADARQEFESQREEIKNRNSEEYNVLKISLESTIEELERHFEQAHAAYLASTDARTQSFRELTERDAASAHIIEKRMRKLVRLQDSLAHWRTKIASNGREWEQRNQALREEKEVMNRHYQNLKGRMNRFREAEIDRLKQLSLNSRAATDSLQEKVRAAERILVLAELNRKMETEQEKVVPFHPIQLDPALEQELAAKVKREQEAAAAASGSPHAAGASAPDAKAAHFADEGYIIGGSAGVDAASKDELVEDGKHLSSYALDEKGNPISEWDYLNYFFTRHNKVALDKLAIEKEFKRLSAENEDLRQILKEYLDGTSVNADVINDPNNPLFIVNQRLQKTLTGTMGRTAGAPITQAPPGSPARQRGAPVLVLQHNRSAS